MPAATRSDVNPETPVIHVDAASVSVARDGSYHLLLRTSVGAGRFIMPLAVGEKVFRVTNPKCAHIPKEKDAPVTKPNGSLL